MADEVGEIAQRMKDNVQISESGKTQPQYAVHNISSSTSEGEQSAGLVDTQPHSWSQEIVARLGWAESNPEQTDGSVSGEADEIRDDATSNQTESGTRQSHATKTSSRSQSVSTLKSSNGKKQPATTASTNGARSDESKGLSAQINSIIEDGTRDPASQAPGVVVQIVEAMGKTLAANAAGVRSLSTGQEMTTDTSFWIASCTKLVTSIAVMQLYEEGKAPLDDSNRLEEICPELKDIKILKNGQLLEKKNRITLRQLLTHTAGFTYSFFNEEIWKNNMQENEDNDELGGGWAAFARQPLIFEPGTNRSYGIGIDWCGVYVERVSKKTLGQYFSDMIFKPLGMKNTGFVLTDETRPKVATMHQRSRDFKSVTANKQHLMHSARPDYNPSQLPFHSGGGGLISTADDYCRIIAAILNDGKSPTTGGRILKHETVDLMFTNQLAEWNSEYTYNGFPVARPNLAQSFLRDGIKPQGPEGWGLSFQLYGDSRHETSANKVGTVFYRAGAPGLSNCFWSMDREKGVGGVLLSQILPFADPPVIDMWAQVQAVMYGEGAMTG